MSRNKFFLLIGCAVILIGVVVYLLVKPGTPQNPDGAIDTTDLFPVIGSKNQQITGSSTGTETETPSLDGEIATGEPIVQSRLTRISALPVAGGTPLIKEKIDPEDSKKKVYELWVRYVEKGRGFVYEKNMAELSSERKLSTTTIPHIEEAIFLGSDTVALRYLGNDLETIQTFIGTIPKEIPGGDSPSVLRGYFMTENIKAFVVSPSGKKFFHLFSSNEATFGTLTDVASNKKSQFFESAFGEWAPTLSTNGEYVFLLTKPSALVPGYLYRVTPPGNTLVKILGNINGLTTLPNNTGTKVLYTDNTLSLSSYDVVQKTTTPIGIKTLPEKCVWQSDGVFAYCFVPNTLINALYPDAWYQGTLHFNDSLWRINTSTGGTEFIANISGIVSGGLDATKLFLAPNESTIFFINKKDLTLWSYTLDE